ncbi:hypothetical protein F2Q69_00043230 [Brassica cretica]|uniref:Uncharacterized protein n=1 Tax=Brassica cretica TaxID=69181 RepID=A0A8S9NET5_BRACR|nr:hypothetical protein F2Q69_00043230 [Brassica cretica]
MLSIDARPRTSIDIHQSKLIDRNSKASIDDAYRVNRVLQCREDSNSQGVHSKGFRILIDCREDPKL